MPPWPRPYTSFVAELTSTGFAQWADDLVQDILSLDRGGFNVRLGVVRFWLKTDTILTVYRSCRSISSVQTVNIPFLPNQAPACAFLIIHASRRRKSCDIVMTNVETWWWLVGRTLSSSPLSLLLFPLEDYAMLSTVFLFLTILSMCGYTTSQGSEKNRSAPDRCWLATGEFRPWAMS